ncbi:hypothetical protein [Natronobeatus ordinarius]|nr:hypothetical protein [Natronobeatus ordinarius]
MTRTTHNRTLARALSNAGNGSLVPKPTIGLGTIVRGRGSRYPMSVRAA